MAVLSVVSSAILLLFCFDSVIAPGYGPGPAGQGTGPPGQGPPGHGPPGQGPPHSAPPPPQGPPQGGYQQSQGGYQQDGYQQANNGYPQANNGYPQHNNGYQQPNNSYQQGNGYPPNQGYGQQQGYGQNYGQNYGGGPTAQGPPAQGPPGVGPPVGVGPPGTGAPGAAYNGPPPENSQPWINQQRDQQLWDKISYVYWTIPNETRNNPTITPRPWVTNVEWEANTLFSMLAPTGQTKSDKQNRDPRIKAVKILTSLSTDQRQKLDGIFTSTKKNNGKNAIKLKKMMVDKYMYNSEKFMKIIIQQPDMLDAFYLNEALTGVKDHKDLREIATTRSNKQYARLKEAFRAYHNGKTTLETVLEGATKAKVSMKAFRNKAKEENPYLKLLLKIFNGERDEYNWYEHKHLIAQYQQQGQVTTYQNPKDDIVRRDASTLINLADSRDYSEILGERSYGHIRAIMTHLRSFYGGKTLEGLIQEKFKSDDNYRNLLLTICDVVTDMPRFFAKRFQEAMKGTTDTSIGGRITGGLKSVAARGLNDDDFIRYIYSRSQVDLGDIIQAYAALYPTSRGLLGEVCKEREVQTNPEYKHGIIMFMMGNDPMSGYQSPNFNFSRIPPECAVSPQDSPVMYAGFV